MSSIGGISLQAQSGGSGIDAGDLACVHRGPQFFAAVRRLLHQEAVATWPEGWALAERLGPPVLPALRGLLRQETNALKRYVLIGAIAAASRVANADSWLLEIATAKGRSVEEATLSLLCLAVGSRRDSVVPAFEQVVADERPGSFVTVAAALASTRSAGTVAVSAARPAASLADSLAAAICGALPADTLHRAREALRDPTTSPIGALVLRAALLAPGPATGAIADATEAIARGLLNDAKVPTAVRVAAALRLGGQSVRLDGDVVIDLSARAALSFFPAARQELRRRGQLVPIPEVLADARTRAQLAVAYAQTVSWSTLIAEVDRWTLEPPLADAVKLTLAWRAGNDPPPEAVGARLVRAVGAGPTSYWLVWALGGRPDRAWLDPQDPRPARIAALASATQLSGAIVLREIEGELWRSGAHPGCVAHGAWTDLVRDALLAGSDLVGARLHVKEWPLPRGIESSNDKFFLVADALHRFLTERVPAPPPELRLR